jgi:hypothetical protein
MLMALGGLGNEHENLLDLLMYIGQNQDYSAMWEEAVRSNGLVLPTLDGVATRAIQSMCNMNKSQMKQLRSCLKLELDSLVFSTGYKVIQVLGLEHIEPTSGTYKYGTEKIDWPYKPIKQVLELWLKLSEKQYDHLDKVVTIDHGKGHSCVTCNFITCTWNPKNEEWQEEENAYTIGTACCRKDNANIMMNTFGTLLNDNLKALPGIISMIEGKAEFGGKATT